MRHAGQGLHQWQFAVARPLERQTEQQLQSGGTGLGLGKWQFFFIGADRHMVRYQRVDGAVLQRLAQSLAVALLAQRRIEAGAAIKVAHIHIRQVQGVDAYITRYWQPLCLGLTQQLCTGRAAQATDMHARTGGAHQLKNRVQGDGLGGHRHAA